MNAIELLEMVVREKRAEFSLKILDNQDGFAEMIAMSNSKGGIILVGVQDKTGEIVGLDYPSLQDANNRIATIANGKTRYIYNYGSRDNRYQTLQSVC